MSDDPKIVERIEVEIGPARTKSLELLAACANGEPVPEVQFNQATALVLLEILAKLEAAEIS